MIEHSLVFKDDKKISLLKGIFKSSNPEIDRIGPPENRSRRILLLIRKLSEVTRYARERSDIEREHAVHSLIGDSKLLHYVSAVAISRGGDVGQPPSSSCIFRREVTPLLTCRPRCGTRIII